MLPIDYGPAADPARRPGEPLVESVWVEPYPDEQLGLEDGFAAPEARYEQRESVELAFIAALQHLPAATARRADPARRARLLGRARSPTCSRRRRRRCTARCSARTRPWTSGSPTQSQQATLRSLGDAALREVVDGYVDAWERGDVDAVAAMLAEDATIAMPPIPTWYRGPRSGRLLPRAPAACGRAALAPRACTRERAAGIRPLPVGRRDGQLRGAQHQRARSPTALGSRRSRRSSTPTCSRASACPARSARKSASARAAVQECSRCMVVSWCWAPF